jgi:hypothetical protein
LEFLLNNIAHDFQEIKRHHLSQQQKWNNLTLHQRDKLVWDSLSDGDDQVIRDLYNLFAKSYTIITEQDCNINMIELDFPHATLIKIFDLCIKYAENVAFQ